MADKHKTVKIIKAKNPDVSLSENVEILRVAAYVRVSTLNDEQIDSFYSQVKFIKTKLRKTLNGLWSIFMPIRV